uniref:Phosphoglycerate kinase n=1 Tax=Oryza nivara TaxID=4536 RepID=A0A0E0ISK0_ORYNI
MFARTHVIRPGPSPRRLIPRWLPPPNGTEAEATHLAAPRARDLRHLHGEKRASGSASSSSSTGRDGGGCPPGSVRADGSGAAATKERFSDSSASVRGARKDGLMQKACSVQLLRPSRSRRRESWPQLGGSVPPQSASVVHLEEEDKYSCIDHSTSYLHVQSVRDFPIEKLNAEVVLVRLDSELLCNPLGSCNLSLERTVSTIKYLHKAGAKIGGSNFLGKAPALNLNIPIYYPTDTWCLNNKNNNHEKLEILDSAELLPGWTPADIGPSTLEKISSLIPLYKKVLWIGPTGFDLTEEFSGGAAQLGRILDKASHDSCDVILVGSAACKAVKGISGSSSKYTTFKNASVVLEFLKGKILPGVAALDKSYPYQIPWNAIFSDSSQPLVVDIGSGNGLFLFQMARNWEGSNFLGLEMNKKLVVRCLRDVASVDKRNLYFVSTNATSTFRSIVSSYPGQLALVTIQCPNPDFNIEQNRWRMVRRMLVEAIADLLQPNGKSDVESVLLGMKEQFMTHGKGQLVVDDDGGGDHQMDNPFGAASDWERHVLARGAPMYRTMLRKVSCKITKDETQS